MSPTLDALLTIVQYLGAAVLGYLGVRYTGKRAERAQASSQGSADLKAAAEEWRALKEDYASRLKAVEERQEALEGELKTEREHSRKMDDDLQRLRSRLGRWTKWAQDLSKNWDTLRTHPTPPPIPTTEE